MLFVHADAISVGEVEYCLYLAFFCLLICCIYSVCWSVLQFCFTIIIIIIIIIIHEFHADTSLKQNFRAAVNVTY